MTFQKFAVLTQVHIEIRGLESSELPIHRELTTSYRLGINLQYG